jgi:hypothetical protein
MERPLRSLLDQDSSPRERLLGLVLGEPTPVDDAGVRPLLVRLQAQEIGEVWTSAASGPDAQGVSGSASRQYFGGFLVNAAARKFVGQTRTRRLVTPRPLPPPFESGASDRQDDPAWLVGGRPVEVVHRGVHGALVDADRAQNHPGWFFLEGRPITYGGDFVEIALYGAVSGAVLVARNERPGWLARAGRGPNAYMIRAPYEISARELLRPAG